MGNYDGIEDAQAPSATANSYIQPGNYLLEVDVLKEVDTDQQGTAFIAEFKVLESDNPAFAPGTTTTWFRALRQRPSKGEIKGLAQALNQGQEVTADLVEGMVDESNPAAGLKVRCRAWEHTTKAGKPFTKTVFTPVS